MLFVGIMMEKGMKIIKRTIVFVLLSVMVGSLFGCASMELKDYVPSDEKYFSFTEINGELEDGVEGVVGYSVKKNGIEELPESINIPAEYLGKPVTAIEDNAFKGAALKSVCIPSSVKTVGDSAFADCTTLKKVFFYSGKSGCEAIGNSAFANCAALTELDMPKTLTKIGDFAFSFCGIQSVEIPRPVEEIGKYAFAFCSSLEKVEIAVKLKTVGESAFAQCADNMVMIVAKSNPYFYAENGNLVPRG